jgi:membrane-associated HD superfamily phosphohydrolase
MRNKISYVPFSKSIVDEVTSNVVMFSDDISEEVLKSVCQMWNTKATDNAIQGMLDRSPLCTQEESEYIMEQLCVYEKSLQNVEPVQENVERKLTAEEQKEETLVVSNGYTSIDTGLPITSLKKTRTKPTAAVKSGGKVLSGEDAVKALKLQQEKVQKQIACIEWLDSSTVEQEFPDGLQKDAIELLIRYGKDLAKMKSEYIAAIQQL